MGIRFKFASSLLVLLITGMMFPSIAAAESEAVTPTTTSNTFEKGFFSHDRNFYDNTTTLNRQIDFLV